MPIETETRELTLDEKCNYWFRRSGDELAKLSEFLEEKGFDYETDAVEAMIRTLKHLNKELAREIREKQLAEKETNEVKDKKREDIPATHSHDAGAIARCSYCGRYSDRPLALSRTKHLVCDCGKTHGWSGSFKRPDENSIWSERSDFR